jgi:hypothetical protein
MVVADIKKINKIAFSNGDFMADGYWCGVLKPIYSF